MVTDVSDNDHEITVKFERAAGETYSDSLPVPGHFPPEDTPYTDLESDLLKFCRSEQIPHTFESFAGDNIIGESVPITKTPDGDYELWIPTVFDEDNSITAYITNLPLSTTDVFSIILFLGGVFALFLALYTLWQVMM